MRIDSWNAEIDGPFSETALRRKIEGLGFCVTRYVYPPSTYFPRHTHPMDKMDAVVSGEFRVVLEETEVLLKAGDALFVPAGAVHSAEVMGNSSVVSLDGVKQ